MFNVSQGVRVFLKLNLAHGFLKGRQIAKTVDRHLKYVNFRLKRNYHETVKG